MKTIREGFFWSFLRLPQPIALLFLVMGAVPSGAEADVPVDATAIYASVEPSLCAVLSIDDRGKEIGFGSGFVLSPDGRIVTNAHVVAGAKALRVECGSKKGVAQKVVAYKSGLDLVVLQTNLANLKPLRLGNKNPAKPGMVVFAIGNPYGMTNTITAGLLSGSRDIAGISYLQFSAEINPGSSGGPLVTTSGDVIGIATLSVTKAKGLGFALPVELIHQLPSTNINFEAIADIRSGERIKGSEQPIVSDLSFRGLQLGTSCNAILRLPHHEELYSDLGPPLFRNLGRKSDINPSGTTRRVAMLFNHPVGVAYECRYGLLVAAGYYEIPKHLEDRVLAGLHEKYGPATEVKKRDPLDFNFKYEREISYILKQGQQIRYRADILGNGELEYSDANLTRFLEKKEALKAAASGEL